MKFTTSIRTEESRPNEKTARTTMAQLRVLLDDIKKMNTLLAMHEAGKISYHLDRQYDVRFVLTCLVRDEEGDITTIMSYELYNIKKIMKQAKLHLKDIQNGITAGD